MFFLSKILQVSQLPRCFLSRYHGVAYEFIKIDVDINSVFFHMTKVGIYTNLSINFDSYISLMNAIHAQLAIVQQKNKGTKICVDHFGVNMGKFVHFGHIRSLVYGCIFKNICNYYGFQCDNDAHLGDSCTHIQKYATYLQAHGVGLADIKGLTLDYLHNIYIQMRAPDAHQHSPISPEYCDALLVKINSVTRCYLNILLDKLDIKFDAMLSESRYVSLCEFLKQWGLDKGYFMYDQCDRLVTNNNLVLTNSKGMPLYAFYDLATVLERYLYGYHSVFYVVDKRQSSHFQMLFAFVKNIGIQVNLVHIPYGYVFDINNQIMSSREQHRNLAQLFDDIHVKLGYQYTEIRLAIILFEFRHRINSNYIFVERIFHESLAEARLLITIVNFIQQEYCNKTNVKEHLSDQEQFVLTKMLQLYEATYLACRDANLDRIALIFCDIKALLLSLDMNNVSKKFCVLFVHALPIFNVFFS